MLCSPAGEQVTVLPHKEDYEVTQERLSETERKLVREIFEDLINSGKIHSSIALGALTLEKDEVLHALLKRAAGGDKADVGRLFGLYLYNAFMENKEKWIFKVSDSRLDNGGYTYWREGYKAPKVVNW